MTSIIARGLKKGSYVILDNEPCKVSSVTKSKTGRHGSTKVRIDAVGLFDNRKRLVVKPGGATMEIPMIKKGTAQVNSISEDVVQLMDLGDYSTFEASIPEEFKNKLNPGTVIVYWKIGTKTVLKEIKT